MKKYIGFIMLAFLMSCKAKKAVVTASIPETKGISAEKVIAGHYGLKSDFKTLYMKSEVRYRDEHQSQNVSAEIKIQKDEKILLSIRFLGITMAKGLITPKEVKYYEKINGTYFEGDFSSLSRWLGTDLDFYKIQNMLIGEALDDLKKGKYNTAEEGSSYSLSTDPKEQFQKTFFIDNGNYVLRRQEILQPAKNRKLQVSYNDFKSYSNILLPTSLFIEALQGDKKTSISINNSQIVLNQELSFPYKTPEGYNRIIID